ncbi:hypothetical protein D9758_006539 [Tetrapyrgos nigripes]|uniref:HAT C-terminal dimerisation domain-containing protein n=1 Tax=Tetrapyrgos nigripes TaxID=182062 RepID=A0A8H5GL74_9AGAR|nr:hypothetical protein D9758_006539 [Tetrapyrgos nigripes]
MYHAVITEMAAAFSKTDFTFGTYSVKTLKGQVEVLYRHLKECDEAPDQARAEANTYLSGVKRAVLPGHDVLSGRILNEEVGKAEAETRVEVNGCFGTGQSDGWKNVAKNSLITAMVNVEYKTHLLNVTDISSQLKTAETLLSIILKEIDHVQTILILKLPVVKVTDQALEVIKWFLSHSIALGLLNNEQSRINSAVVLILILPVLTCWTSHYLSMDHLLLLELPLWTKETGKGKSTVDLQLLGREDFWRNLKFLHNLLKPFAIATNATQADHCQLDTILLLLGYLYHIHNNDSHDACIHCAIHASLEKHWKKVDREVFILAVIFNPFIRQHAFKSGGPFHSTADLWHVVCRVFRQFYGRTPDTKFRKAGTGKWSYEMMDLDYFCQDAKEQLSLTDMQQNTYVNIVQIWEEHLMSSDKNDISGVNGMVVLAMRIMSMVPNSAGIEQRFSKFGAVHTKLRNCMGAQKTSRKITVLDDHIQQKHGTQPHYKRSHGQSKDAQDISAATTRAVAAPGATAQPEDDLEDAIHEELGVLDINDDENRAEEGEGDAGDTVEGLLEDEAWGEEYGPDDLMPDQPLDEEALKLENLFDYPSLSDADNQTFAFMMEFWQRGESGLHADTLCHETLTSELGGVGSIDDSDDDNSI